VHSTGSCTDFPRPKTPKELFNLRHAQARNVVERIIGVLKCRFAIARGTSFWPMATQTRIVAALCVIHNFIRHWNPEDLSREEQDLDGQDDSDQDRDEQENRELETRGGTSQLHPARITATEAAAATARRDEIANRMWEQYQTYNVHRSAHNGRS